MRTLMIIPAKGYSRRLSGKNVKLFCGHPLVAWSIVQGVQAKHVDEVWVSTDDDEIAGIAERYGAQVMFRNYKDDDETPGTVPVVEWLSRMHAAGLIETNDRLITRLCTTPTLMPHDIDAAIELYWDLHARYGATAVGMSTEIRTWRAARKVVENIKRGVSEDCQCENNYEIVQCLAFFGMFPARKLLGGPEVEIENKHRRLYGGDHSVGYYYKVQPWQMQDVDTPDEWEFAQVVAEHYILQGRDMVEVYKNG